MAVWLHHVGLDNGPPWSLRMLRAPAPTTPRVALTDESFREDQGCAEAESSGYAVVLHSGARAGRCSTCCGRCTPGSPRCCALARCGRTAKCSGLPVPVHTDGRVGTLTAVEFPSSAERAHHRDSITRKSSTHYTKCPRTPNKRTAARRGRRHAHALQRTSTDEGSGQ